MAGCPTDLEERRTNFQLYSCPVLFFSPTVLLSSTWLPFVFEPGFRWKGNVAGCKLSKMSVMQVLVWFLHLCNVARDRVEDERVISRISFRWQLEPKGYEGSSDSG